MAIILVPFLTLPAEAAAAVGSPPPLAQSAPSPATSVSLDGVGVYPGSTVVPVDAFSVTMASTSQSNQGALRINLSKSSGATSSSMTLYVIVQNIGPNPIRVSINGSDWYNCLHFQIQTPSGQTFTISRPPLGWAADAPEPWLFQPNGIKVFEVDFSQTDFPNTWAGIPSDKDIPKGSPFKIQVVFNYRLERNSAWFDAIRQ